MKRNQNPRKTLGFIFIASLLMIITDFIFFPFTPSKGPYPPPSPPEKIYEHSEIKDYESGLEHTGGQAEILAFDIPQPEPIKNNAESLVKIIKNPAPLNIKKNIIPAPANPRPAIKGKGRVAIIIDDMGMDRKRSKEAIRLPAPLTLSFLPYAPLLEDITREASERGHELLIHMPMQPMDSKLNPGPLALREGMSAESFRTTMEHAFASFSGYVGINNHMGSRLTQDRKAMDMVMEALAAKDLIFVDSKTISTSVAAQSAAEHGLRFSERDVFLDHVDSKEFVMQALYQLEIIAKKRGYAVAIGHPKDVTIAALKEWLPEMKKRGLTLVPVSAVARTDFSLSPSGRGLGEGVMYGPPAPAPPP